MTIDNSTQELVTVHINLPEKKARRIIKAAHPKKESIPDFDQSSAGSASLSLSSPRDTHSPNSNVVVDNDDDDDNGRHVPDKDFYDRHSPIVAEIEREKVKKIKQERLQSAVDRRKLKSDKAKQERRMHSTSSTSTTSSSDGSDMNGNHKKGSPANAVKANPFSRFLSFLSVEPKHPEHKRAFPIQGKDDYLDLKPPAEKKIRSEEDGKEGGSNAPEKQGTSGTTTSTSTSPHSPAAAPRDGEKSRSTPNDNKNWLAVLDHHQLLASAFVAVAAITCFVVVWGRKKRLS